MGKDFAEKVVEELKAKNGPTLNVLEVMSMKPIVTDGYEIYSIQKGDVTFLAWKSATRVIVQTVAW